MKKILLCVFILLVSVNVFAGDVDRERFVLKQLTEAANSGDAEAQYLLGKSYYFGVGIKQDYEQAVVWSIKAAEQGYLLAQTFLGYYYIWDFGDNTKNINKGMYWLEKAAEQGEALAQGYLGYLYYKGEGVAQNYLTAHMWTSLALTSMTDRFLLQTHQERLQEIDANMTPAEIAEAEQMAAEWMERHR